MIGIGCVRGCDMTRVLGNDIGVSESGVVVGEVSPPCVVFLEICLDSQNTEDVAIHRRTRGPFFQNACDVQDMSLLAENTTRSCGCSG
jgi:hypothetical protein